MDKKAVAEIVTYVMMVSLAVVMAGVVFAWLKFYAQQPIAEESCPDVSIVLSDYNCSQGVFTVMVQNRGRFDIDGFTARIHNGTTFYSIREVNSSAAYISAKMSPNEFQTKRLNYTKYMKIKEVEIEATKGMDKSGRPMLCENSLIRQSISGC